MGGFGSGRHRTQTVGAVEDGYHIDIRALRRAGAIEPGFLNRGSLTWSVYEDRTSAVTMTVEMPTCKDGGFLRVDCTINGAPHSQRVSIVALACRYGGSRYYFLCPVSGRRCEVLALVNGRWASLKAQRVAYSSQSEDRLRRLGRAAKRAEARACGLNRHPKPRGGNAKRLLNWWCDADIAHERAFQAWCRELIARNTPEACTNSPKPQV